MDELFGFIENIVFSQPENGFTVARLKDPAKKELITIIGYIPSLQPGETVLCKGEWKMHPHHGRQFEVKEHSIEAPKDVMGIRKYLESGLVKGLGPVYAEKIVNTFGRNTLKVLDETPQQLLEIRGIGKKRLEKITQSWQDRRSIRSVMIFLRAHGVNPSYAQKIYKKYGDDSIERVKENPYRLAKDVFGIGFKTADTIAEHLGLKKDSPERIEAGIEHTLWELSGEGHTCFPVEELIVESKKILEVEKPLIQQRIQRLIHAESLYQKTSEKKSFVWIGPLFYYEQAIAKELARLKKSLPTIRSVHLDKAVEWVQKQLNIELAQEQQAGVEAGISEKVHIITGGPGTGKTTITQAILTITQKITDKIILAAPTGRAAKRLGQITFKKAYTIHGLLEFDFATGKFKRDETNRLHADLIIVDEASMIDTQLMFHLLRAIQHRTRILFIGDIDQLPSIGPGYVLKDLIASETLGVTRLKEIFRQAKGSKIIVNAHKINHGEIPILTNLAWSDFQFFEEEDIEKIHAKILQLVSTDIPGTWKFDPIRSTQVLSPMKKGMIGIENLNHSLQQILNPSKTPFFRGGRRFHVKDKVMQTRNNYDKNVYNGDVGIIHSIDTTEQAMGIEFDGKLLEYDFSELDEIVLAYAVSVHKYQGSECPCIVMPVHTCHFKLLYRNLLYTAVTRGKKKVLIVGSKKAMAIAINNDQVLKRYTGLKEAMQSFIKKDQETILPGFNF